MGFTIAVVVQIGLTAVAGFVLVWWQSDAFGFSTGRYMALFGGVSAALVTCQLCVSFSLVFTTLAGASTCFCRR